MQARRNRALQRSKGKPFTEDNRAPARFRTPAGDFQAGATVTNPISAGTSTSGPTTAANAAPDASPNTPTATAIASSKLFPAAVKASVAARS